jgi:glutamyl-tRNA reductase
VDIREKFSISEESAQEGLLHLSEQEGIKEAVVLSTCNRTEIYAVLKEEEDKEELYRFFLTLSGNSKAEKEYFFFYTGTECIRHLFRVVSGLDSMVLGESQILNQIKTAYTGALAVHDPYHFKYAFSPRHYHGEKSPYRNADFNKCCFCELCGC